MKSNKVSVIMTEEEIFDVLSGLRFYQESIIAIRKKPHGLRVTEALDAELNRITALHTKLCGCLPQRGGEC